ncbi:MAG TPA: hypothetical protein VFB45_08540 [Pseudolabrys sp.]|nr:hypothetical protein [Pseudolabrys sp.]
MPRDWTANDTAAAEKAARELRVAVERLQADIARVEIWAGALAGFSKPVPDYDGGFHHLLISDQARPRR